MSKSEFGEKWKTFGDGQFYLLQTQDGIDIAEADNETDWPNCARLDRAKDCTNSMSGVRSPERLMEAVRDYRREYSTFMGPGVTRGQRNRAVTAAHKALSRLRSELGDGDECTTPTTTHSQEVENDETQLD